MINVKEFCGKWVPMEDVAGATYEPVDERINNFLFDHKDIKVIDIKYSTVVSQDNEFNSYALLIYKEGE